MMKRQMTIHSAIRLSTLKMAATGMVMAVMLIAQQGQTVTVPGLPGTTHGAVKLVSLNVGNPLPYRVHDWAGKAAENNTGPSSATALPMNGDTVYSEPLSCYPGCKLA